MESYSVWEMYGWHKEGQILEEVKAILVYTTFIAIQNDKMGEALDVMNNIVNNMLESESGFSIDKEALMARLSTQRTTKASVLSNYLDAKRLGLNYNRRKILYENIPNII